MTDFVVALTNKNTSAWLQTNSANFGFGVTADLVSIPPYIDSEVSLIVAFMEQFDICVFNCGSEGSSAMSSRMTLLSTEEFLWEGLSYNDLL